MSAAVALRGVSVFRGDTRVLADVDLTIARGEVVAVLGPSGAGKTTLLRLLLGFDAPSSGSVELDGKVVSRDRSVLVAPEDRRLGIVFQDLALWPHLTVRENLAFGLEARGVPKNQRAERIAEVLSRLELSDKSGRRPDQLSGGERRRVAIGRALVLDPSAILLDEPLANLDVVLKRELTSLFRELFRERHSTVLYVSHDLSDAAAIAGRAVVLEHGRIVQEGAISELEANPSTDFVRFMVRGLT